MYSNLIAKQAGVTSSHILYRISLAGLDSRGPSGTTSLALVRLRGTCRIIVQSEKFLATLPRYIFTEPHAVPLRTACRQHILRVENPARSGEQVLRLSLFEIEGPDGIVAA